MMVRRFAPQRCHNSYAVGVRLRMVVRVYGMFLSSSDSVGWAWCFWDLGLRSQSSWCAAVIFPGGDLCFCSLGGDALAFGVAGWSRVVSVQLLRAHQR